MSQGSSEYKKDGGFSVTNNCCLLVHSALSKLHAKLLSSPALLEHDCWRVELPSCIGMHAEVTLQAIGADLCCGAMVIACL